MGIPALLRMVNGSYFLVPFFVYAFANNFVPYLPILPFIYAQLGFSMWEMGVISAVGNVLIVLLEIPTGAVADRYGRKASILLGIVSSAIGLLLVLLMPKTFVVMVTWVAFQAVGTTLISGSDRALLFDGLKTRDQEHRYQTVSGQFMGLGRFSGLLATLLAGVLYEGNGMWILLVVALIARILAFLSMLMVRSEGLPRENSRSSYRAIVRSSFVEIRRDRNLAYLIYLYALLGATGIAWEYRSLFISIRMAAKPSLVAGLTSVTTLLYAASLYLSGKARSILSRDSSRFSLLLVPFGIIAAVLLPGGLGLLAFLVYVCLGGVLLPYIDTLLNRSLRKDEVRTTVLSTANLARSLLYSLVLLVFGWLGKYGFMNAMAIISGTLIVICSVFLLNGRRVRGSLTSDSSEGLVD